MSTVGELKVTISFKDTIKIGMEILIEKEQLKKKAVETGNVIEQEFKKVFGKKRSLTLEVKVKAAEVTKKLKELEKKFKDLEAIISSGLVGKEQSKKKAAEERGKPEKKFKDLKASISPTLIEKSMNSLREWTEGKVLDAKISIVLGQENFKENMEDLYRKAKGSIEKIKQKLQPLSKIFSPALALKDMAGDKLKTLMSGPQRVFSSIASGAKTAFGKAVGFLGKSVDIKGFAGNIAGRLKAAGGSVFGFVKAAGSSMLGFAKVAGSSMFGIAKAAGSSMLGFAKAGFAGLAGIAAQGVKQAAEAAIEGGAILEQQNLYMDQAIAASSPQMGAEEVKGQRDVYMKQLRDSAAGAGMDSGDVVGAGTKAVSIAGGDTKAAMALVKVAQDMAAMNPGKTVAEAMSALAAAKNGEAEALKDFNAGVSQEDLDSLGFEAVMQQKLKPQFSGGAEKLSGTGAGLVSVIKGKLNNKLQDMGLGIIEKLKPALEGVVKLIDRYGPALDAFGEGIASGVDLAIKYVQTLAGSIGERFGWIGQKTAFLKDYFLFCWDNMKNTLLTAWAVIKPVMDLIANGAMLLFNIFQWAFPGIQAMVENVWASIMPIFEGLGSAIGWVADQVGKVAEWLNRKNNDSKGGSAGGPSEAGKAKEENRQAVPASPTEALLAQAVTSTNPQYGTALSHNGNSKISNMPGAYGLPPISPQNGSMIMQNPQITININGVDKSAHEIMNEVVPELKLALTNMGSGSFAGARHGGALA